MRCGWCGSWMDFYQSVQIDCDPDKPPEYKRPTICYHCYYEFKEEKKLSDAIIRNEKRRIRDEST